MNTANQLFAASLPDNGVTAKAQMAWQEAMSSTAHQREVQDLKAAGLNPVLSAGGSGASTPSGSTDSADTIMLLNGITELVRAAQGSGARREKELSDDPILDGYRQVFEHDLEEHEGLSPTGWTYNLENALANYKEAMRILDIGALFMPMILRGSGMSAYQIRNYMNERAHTKFDDLWDYENDRVKVPDRMPGVPYDNPKDKSKMTSWIREKAMQFVKAMIAAPSFLR